MLCTFSQCSEINQIISISLQHIATLQLDQSTTFSVCEEIPLSYEGFANFFSNILFCFFFLDHYICFLVMYWYWLKRKKIGNRSEILSMSVCLNSWQKCACLPPVERRHVPTCSVSMQPSTCRWTRGSLHGLVLSAISLPSLTLYRSMGNVLPTDTFFFFCDSPFRWALQRHLSWLTTPAI